MIFYDFETFIFLQLLSLDTILRAFNKSNIIMFKTTLYMSDNSILIIKIQII